MGNITSEIEHVPMHGFVASRKALHRLLAMRLFTTPSDVVDVHDDLATERLLAALARYWLDSPPLTCSLDGCSPPMCSTDDKGCLPAWERKEEAQCQAYFAYPEHFTTPNFGERARTSVSCGRNRTVLETPLLRHVGPPLRIARPLFAGLLPGPDGTALFGADAMARLEAEPPEARRVLIYLAGHRDSPVFDRWYPRALSLPQARDLWLVRDAAILLLNNNRALPTARLLEKLRPYRQRARWLIAVGRNFRTWSDVYVPTPILATPDQVDGAQLQESGTLEAFEQLSSPSKRVHMKKSFQGEIVYGLGLG